MSTSVLDAEKLIIPGHGTVMFADPNTPMPDISKIRIGDKTTYPAGWAVTYTSKENPPAFDKDGGDQEQKDAWEQEAVATSQAPTTFMIEVNKIQIDQWNLEIAFPGGSWITDTHSRRWYGVGTVGKVEKAVLILMIDGNKILPIYMPRVSLTTGDMPEIDVENFFELKISGTMLSGTGDYTNRIYWGEIVTITSATVAAPTATSVNPASAAAGATVTITGTGFIGATSVKFGGTEATSFQITGETTITAVVPTGATGSAPITVTTPGGTSAPLAFDRTA